MEVLREADKDNSGSVDINEYMTAIINVNSIIDKDLIKEYFVKYDDDNSGCLDYEKIK